jgi:hypothetical protein
MADPRWEDGVRTMLKSSLPPCGEGGTRSVTGGGLEHRSPSVSFGDTSPVKGEDKGRNP